MTVLGHFDHLTCYYAFQHPAGLLPQLSYTYSVAHGVHTAAHNVDRKSANYHHPRGVEPSSAPAGVVFALSLLSLWL